MATLTVALPVPETDRSRLLFRRPADAVVGAMAALRVLPVAQRPAQGRGGPRRRKTAARRLQDRRR